LFPTAVAAVVLFLCLCVESHSPRVTAAKLLLACTQSVRTGLLFLFNKVKPFLARQGGAVFHPNKFRRPKQQLSPLETVTIGG